MNLRKNQSGVGVVEVLLLLIFIGVVGLIGLNITQNRDKLTSQKPDSSSNSTEKNTKKTAEDPYAGWKVHSDESTGVTLRFPAKYASTLSGGSLFLASSTAEQEKEETCIARGECYNFELGIFFTEHKKNPGETYLQTLQRDEAQVGDLIPTKIDGHTAYVNKTSQTNEAFGTNYYNAFIDLKDKVIQINAQYENASTFTDVQQIFKTIKIAT